MMNSEREVRVCEWCNKTSEKYKIIRIKKTGTLLCEVCRRVLRKWGANYENRGELPDQKYIICDNNISSIVITNRQREEIGFTIIDTEDTNKCKLHRWSFDSKGYIKGTINGKSIFLHRFILDPERKNPLFIDHINRNPKDNRKENLRFCTVSENSYNRKSPKKSFSNILGVSYNKRDNLWQAYIRYNGKHENLGSFKNKEDAICARMRAEKEHNIFRWQDEDKKCEESSKISQETCEERVG